MFQALNDCIEFSISASSEVGLTVFFRFIASLRSRSTLLCRFVRQCPKLADQMRQLA